MYSFYLGRNIGNVKNAVKKKDATATFYNLLKPYRIDAFTVIKGVGFWKGTKEKMLIFQVANIPDNTAQKIAEQLARHYEQDAVMLVRHDGDSVFFVS